MGGDASGSLNVIFLNLHHLTCQKVSICSSRRDFKEAYPGEERVKVECPIFFSKGPYCLKNKSNSVRGRNRKEQKEDKKGKTCILQLVYRNLSFIIMIYADVKSIGKLRI